MNENDLSDDERAFLESVRQLSREDRISLSRYMTRLEAGDPKTERMRGMFEAGQVSGRTLLQTLKC